MWEVMEVTEEEVEQVRTANDLSFKTIYQLIDLSLDEKCKKDFYYYTGLYKTKLMIEDVKKTMFYV